MRKIGNKKQHTNHKPQNTPMYSVCESVNLLQIIPIIDMLCLISFELVRTIIWFVENVIFYIFNYFWDSEVLANVYIFLVSLFRTFKGQSHFAAQNNFTNETLICIFSNFILINARITSKPCMLSCIYCGPPVLVFRIMMTLQHFIFRRFVG